MLLANLYFERDEIIKSKPRGTGDDVKVEVFGEFQGKHGSWNKRYECPYDQFFAAYKCQPIGLKVGKCLLFYSHVFKFNTNKTKFIQMKL